MWLYQNFTIQNIKRTFFSCSWFFIHTNINRHIQVFHMKVLFLSCYLSFKAHCCNDDSATFVTCKVCLMSMIRKKYEQTDTHNMWKCGRQHNITFFKLYIYAMNSAFYLISKRLLQFLNYMILLQDMSFFELKLNPFTCELLKYI